MIIHQEKRNEKQRNNTQKNIVEDDTIFLLGISQLVYMET